ncbi:hypothetical protein [uncultured Aquimarina sp.]|uniref:hypothetical protein n=1 Tax=uncultured Aquimarina sp. TaxID=575652 RepID=UPI0026345B22|nr:hypothetical protein [uncultured Aquimarina sp.]
MSTINNRIDSILKNLGLTNKEFGNSLGVTEATIRNLRKKGTVKPIYIELIIYKLNVNRSYLEFGEGDIFNDQPLNTDPNYKVLAINASKHWNELMKFDEFRMRYYLELSNTLSIDLDMLMAKEFKNKN